MFTRHGLLEIFSCARREGVTQELFRHFGEQQCDKSDPPIIIAFGTRKYSLYLWRLLTKIGTCARYANHTLEPTCVRNIHNADTVLTTQRAYFYDSDGQ